MPSDIVLVSTTGDRKEKLETIATALVENRLAACCRIGGPAKSVYRWEGKIESAEEWTLDAKTTADCADRAIAIIIELHNYDLPEVITTAVTGGSEEYLDWIRRETC